MFHQFVLDYLEFILAIIIVLQGIILFKSNTFSNWVIGHLNNLYIIQKAQATLTLDHEDKLKFFPSKKEGGL